MDFVFILSSALGFSMIALITYTLAVLFAKKVPGLSWTLYAIGSVLTVMSLIGNGKEIQLMTTYSTVPDHVAEMLKTQNTANWTVFLIFAVLAFILISSRRKAAVAKKSAEKSGEAGNSPEQSTDGI